MFDQCRLDVAKYSPWATFAYNTFNTQNLANYSPYELVFRKKPKLLLYLETSTFTGTFKDYYNLSNERLQYLHKLLQELKSKRVSMINKDRTLFQYNSRDLVYIISPPTRQLHTTFRKVMIKYVGPVVT